ncbi:MAG: F0F1 ATP synthase subunit B [Sphingomonadaceae bacterium]|nr:F0F1 ATP synthase subunit B [Sphingomonadaceae bacterium]
MAEESPPTAQEIHDNPGVIESHVEQESHAEPTALFLDATGWVSMAMIVVLAIMLWKKVPAIVGSMMDRRIAEIRKEIDEAAKLRAEAEAIKAEYEQKMANADQEAEAMLGRARDEAGEIIAQAEDDAEALVRRRTRLAEDKIAAAERSAIAEVRAKATSAATAAAATIIEQKHDADADKALIDRTIAGLDGRLN